MYFYPKDNTPGCTAQGCALRDSYDDLSNAGYVIFGISSDSAESHRNFLQKYNFPYPLLVDTDKHIHNLYGTWQEKSMYGRKYMGTVRVTFVIDEEGKLLRIIDKVKVKIHARQILEI